ncbi:lysozyme [Novosphingobium mangrovi (ex Huang et al. 2023)]|uniref:Lysozyme n=1 Tax=Novosphingobium mangrovi (ex Huang et al. 2023) TaxID=2976432 RepID=A0ABT2I8L4_9SPHN|nr:lysozyme [Novosphingobium mangrovi (ex Huang et al. 2023)]MCT2401148.1 lysozyme [Novosphingobium mangrovi (ex Huang et al. 2023)]
MLDRKPIFDEVRHLLGRGFDPHEVTALDCAIDRALGMPAHAATGHRLGAAGKALIRKWEGCGKRRADGRFEAYPDPGSADGDPWTIGWGSTGPDIARGVIWTQAQCDARFDRDVAAYAEEVAGALGPAPTTQNQFDALVSFHYNTGAIGTATLTKLHRQGSFAEARGEFGRWIYNDRKPMRGLKARRAEEADLYGRA